MRLIFKSCVSNCAENWKRTDRRSDDFLHRSSVKNWMPSYRNTILLLSERDMAVPGHERSPEARPIKKILKEDTKSWG